MNKKDQSLEQALEQALEQDLGALGDKLKKANPVHPDQALQPSSAPKGMAQGMRLAIDFVSAIGVAAFIGWMLDQWLETAPWIMIGLIPIGFVAGIFNMIRTAKHLDSL